MLSAIDTDSALDALRAAITARHALSDRRLRETTADLYHCANLIAAHHGLSVIDVANALPTLPIHMLEAVDTPEGMTALGFYFAETLGGDASTPLLVAIH